jgi:Tfp pilus assembly protein PilN
MIKINLLPEKPASAAVKYDLYLSALITLFCILVIVAFYYVNAHYIGKYKEMIASTKRDIAGLDRIYSEYLALDKARKDTEKKIRAISGMKEGRALAARSIYDLTTAVKDNLWLKTFRKTQNRFELEGRSLENESISGFMESLSKIPYITNVELRTVEDASEEGLTLKKFVIHGNMGL